MTENALSRKARAYVKAIIRERKPVWVKYHDFRHAQSVAEASEAIGAASGLDEEVLEVVILAAWFHDAGYMEGVKDHEERSAALAAAFLRENDYPEEKIAQVAACIHATKMPQNPRNIVEQVLCDADIAHLGEKGYLQRSECVRDEIEHRRGSKLTDLEWLTMNIDFVAGHRYFTDYARTRFEEGRVLNLATLRERLNRLKTHGNA